MTNQRRRLGRFIPGALTFGDWVILNISFLVSYISIGQLQGIEDIWIWLITNASFIPFSNRLYHVHARRTVSYDQLMRICIKSGLMTTCVAVSLLYLFKIDVDIKIVVFFLVLFCVLLSGWCQVARKIIRSARARGYNYKKALVVGSGRTARQLIQQVTADPAYGIRIVGVFEDDPKRIESIKPYYKAPIMPLDDVHDTAIAREADIIYFTNDGNDVPQLLKMMHISEEIGAKFIYVPKLPKLMSGQFKAAKTSGMHTLEHHFTPLDRMSNRVVKRIFDLCVAVPFAILSPLVFVPIAIGIKLTSPGPIFFKQKRTGLYGKDFTCLKFRTMKVNTDSDKVQATEHDPRKTKFGNFLRKTSLDELPQFYNVLFGDMTVVGPRPHMVSQTEEYSQLIDQYMIRHAVKPGITGWAQINGYRGATKELWQMEKRVEHDVWYISNWNVFLDIKIVLLTFINQLRGEENAY